jgi:hypothetical protein|tara:strand:- start:77 stop:388 length:312 start_codon:yes stop_codon:yes gene_type:complete
MKARRASGATHSFRLTRRAADIVDRLSYPRKLGGKSQLISEAICYYFGGDDDGNTIHDLRERVKWWMNHAEEIKQGQISEPRRGVWSTIRTTIGRWIGRIPWL